jgi:hypothetical protein
MDLSFLERLGKIAGLGGICVGAAVLLLHALIGSIPGLPAAEQVGIVRTLTYLAFAIGIIGIIAWVIGARSAGSRALTKGKQSAAVVAGGNVAVGYGATEPSPSAAPTPGPAANPPAGATARTVGDESPAVVAGGNAAVRYGPGQPTKSESKGN